MSCYLYYVHVILLHLYKKRRFFMTTRIKLVNQPKEAESFCGKLFTDTLAAFSVWYPRYTSAIIKIQPVSLSNIFLLIMLLSLLLLSVLRIYTFHVCMAFYILFFTTRAGRQLFEISKAICSIYIFRHSIEFVGSFGNGEL